MKAHTFELLRAYCELTKWPAPSGVIAQLVEHCTCIAEVMGLNPVHSAGRKIVPNTGANATKFFTLVTKS